MVTISKVLKDSPAAACRLRPGDRLISINGHPINDFLDYEFYEKEEVLTLEVETDTGLFGIKRPSPKRATISLDKGDEPLGLEFDSYLMSDQRTCQNNCIFCFIDQMPPGLRPSLYVKDDDARLSFLFGNYITMTNLSEEEFSRIIRMHISPINLSVHTTNPALRCKMMNNRFAGDVMERMRQLVAHGIVVNCQIVACPGYNDKEELERTLTDLASLGESVGSVAIVPVGKTKYREGLTKIDSFDADSAAELLDRVEKLALAQKKKTGRYLFHASDEFYLLAGRELPLPERYEEYPQLENGIGMCTLLRQQVAEELAGDRFPPREAPLRKVSIATGCLAAPILTEQAQKISEKFPWLQVEVFPVQNELFGEEITVAGLLCGKDLKEQLTGKELGECLYLTCHMLESEGERFLDDMTVQELSDALEIPICIVGETGAELISALLG